MEKYAMYLRKSRADIELEAISHEETLARHKELLFNLAERHEISSNQIEIYHEIVSGDSIDSRPEMQRLLDDVYERKYKGVLVVEVERLARGNTKDQGEVAEAFQQSDTFIITPAKVYDPNNEADQEYFEFGLFMSRREYNTIKRRLSSGKYASVKEGNFIPSKPPLGYDVKRIDKKNRILVENEEKSKIVRMIFNWWAVENRTTSWIATELTTMGIPTAKGINNDWSKGTISDMLRNQHYVGNVVWNSTKQVKIKDPVTGKTRKKSVRTRNPEIFKGKHEGIISEELFQQAQEKFGKRPKQKYGTELINPFATILVCKHCGQAMRLQVYPDNRMSRYMHKAGIHQCKMKSATYDVVMESVVESLKKYQEDFRLKLESGDHNDSEIQHQKEIEVVEAELSKQQRMKRKLFDSWESDDGMYTKAEFIDRKNMYNSKIEALEEKVAEMKKSCPAPIDYSERIVTIHQLIDCLNNPDISAEDKNLFLRKNIEKITYDSVDLGTNKGAKPILELFLK